MKCSPDRVQMVQNRLMWIISFVMKLFGTVQNGIRLNQTKWSPIMTHIMLIIPKFIRLQLLRMLALLIWPLGGAIYIAVQNIPSDFALANLAQFQTDWPIMCLQMHSCTRAIIRLVLSCSLEIDFSVIQSDPSISILPHDHRKINWPRDCEFT